jgi:hypothetical protein
MMNCTGQNNIRGDHRLLFGVEMSYKKVEAVTSKSPNLRYLVGKDVETWAANKKTMGDTEFHNMMRNLIR